MSTGDGCTVNGNIQTIEYALMNQHEFDADIGWVAAEFNPYYRDFTVDANFASCTTISVGLGKTDICMRLFTCFSPLPCPCFLNTFFFFRSPDSSWKVCIG